MDFGSFIRYPLLYFQRLDDPTINLIPVMVLIWSTGVLFRKTRQPPVLGKLLAGIIFGPALLNIIRPDHTMEVLPEHGIINDVYFSRLVVAAFLTILIPPVALSFLLENVKGVKAALVKN